MFNHKLLRNMRLEAGMTQEEVAQKSGMQVRWYQKIESGNNVPQVKHIVALAKLFHIATEDFLKEDVKEKTIEK